MELRNVAIIAHVDHGKTTLVDQMFRQSGVFRRGQEVAERIMDSNPLERERGITILSKNTSVEWRGVKLNIVDTPGHADFGGEVERILRMVDGVLLLVDAAEGPMPQTRFVTRKALDLGLAPLIVINKVDRGDARPEEVQDEVLELLIDLDATDEQLDAPFLYAVGRDGWASDTADEPGTDLAPLFDAVLEHVPAPQVSADGPFQMLVSTLDHSSYLGRIAIGRVERGRLAVGDPVARIGSEVVENARAGGLFTFSGLERLPVDEVRAGDIVALAGLARVEIGDTIADPASPDRLSGITVEEPTITVDFSVNDSPFAGRSGKYVTTRQLSERLDRELERNVALRVAPTERTGTFSVSGRGELHLTVLMETMRREGYEFMVSRPRVVTRTGENGQTLEPFEEVVAEVPNEATGTVIEKLGRRRGKMTSMRPVGDSRVTRLEFRVPARGLFGYRTDFLTDTKGEGTLHHRFHSWDEWAGPVRGRSRGALVADRQGKAVAFALFGLQERGELFVDPGIECYGGMIVGECSRSGDMDVNVSRQKKLTNMRTTAADEALRLETPRRMTLELALEFIADDELIEVTPDEIRLRKRQLDPNRRRKAKKAAKAESAARATVGR
ncbi:MAG: translational GTPase TypA [Gemmatimonadetes bacterium]|nr:translational GTPase TypA [Gemmatimonadota bacterium]